jgi:hypothetical protein
VDNGSVTTTEEGELVVKARAVRRSLVLTVLVALLAVGGLAAAPRAGAAPPWAPVESASIRPGGQLLTPIGQCTSNFVFVRGEDVFLGTAAHCFGEGSASDLNGCSVGSLPEGSPVQIRGATRPGQLAYSSWGVMKDGGEEDPLACRFNDFALVRVDPADHGRVNPSIPHWGGPTGMRDRALTPFWRIHSLGNSGLRGGLPLLQPKVGISVGTSFGGWLHTTYQLLPGIPGDSGGPMVDDAGRAAGVLSSLGVLPVPGTNQMTDVALAVHYARTHGVPGLRLVRGTVPFNHQQLPLG